MTREDAVVRPVSTRRTPKLGPLALFVATDLDIQILRQAFDLPLSRSLYMSRIYYNSMDPVQPVVVGPILGSPYAVMLLEILRSWGVQKAFFIGWCGSIDQNTRIGDIIVPTGAWIDEGTSAHYGANANAPVQADKNLIEMLQNGLLARRINYRSGTVWTTDAVFRETPEQIRKFQQLAAIAVEMELSALLSAAAFYGLPMAAILIVSDELFTLQWQPGFKSEVFKQSRCDACGLFTDLLLANDT